jgi:uncharacterized membrane protein
MKFQLERILLFSDAVFAIAITLMIIEIKPPHLEHDITFTDALNKFLSTTPLLFGTILSFCMIGLYWYKHHDLMKHLSSYNAKFIRMNFALLLSVAFIPYSTAFLMENTPTSFTLLIYNINYIIVSLLILKIYNYALNPKNNLCSENLEHEMLNLRKETFFSVSIFSLVILLGFISIEIAPICYALFGFYSFFVRNKHKVEQ